MRNITLTHLAKLRNARAEDLAKVILVKSINSLFDDDEGRRKIREKYGIDENQRYIELNPEYFRKAGMANISQLSLIGVETSITYLTDPKSKRNSCNFLDASCMAVPGSEIDPDVRRLVRQGPESYIFFVEGGFAFENFKKEEIARGKNTPKVQPLRLFYGIENAVCDKEPDLCAADFDRQENRIAQKANMARIQFEGNGKDEPRETPNIDINKINEILRARGYSL